MDTKVVSPLSIIALALGLLPLCALLPGVFGLTLSDDVRTGWTIANFVFIAASLIVVIIAQHGGRDCSAGTRALSTLTIVLDVFWVLLTIGIIALALVVSFQSGNLSLFQ